MTRNEFDTHFQFPRTQTLIMPQNIVYPLESYIKGRSQTESGWEQTAEVHIWTQQGRGMKWQEDGEECMMRNFVIFTLFLLLGWLTQEGWDGQGM
jgi:hypothetical protein